MSVLSVTKAGCAVDLASKRKYIPTLHHLTIPRVRLNSFLKLCILSLPTTVLITVTHILGFCALLYHYALDPHRGRQKTYSDQSTKQLIAHASVACRRKWSVPPLRRKNTLEEHNVGANEIVLLLCRASCWLAHIQ